MPADAMPEDTGLSEHEHVYAIIRIDSFHEPQVSLEDKIRIKMLVWTQEAAENEVKRLNELNAARGAFYFWRRARLARRDKK